MGGGAYGVMYEIGRFVLCYLYYTSKNEERQILTAPDFSVGSFCDDFPLQ